MASSVSSNSDTSDWRAQLQPDSRQRNVNKIMETLWSHHPVSDPEDLNETRKIALRFEDKVYTSATSQSDYLWKIFLKMLKMETTSQNSMANPMPSIPVGNSNGPLNTDTSGWRAQLQPDFRQRFVNKIMETLGRHLPVYGLDGLYEIRKIAFRFEEKVYTRATTQNDYTRTISLKMLAMETKSQNSMANPMSSIPVGSSNGALNTGHGMQSQVQNQEQSLPVPPLANQPQSPQNDGGPN